MRRMLIFYTVILAGLLFSGCNSGDVPGDDSESGQSTLILISIDGMRHDYPDQASTPNLDKLISAGIRATSLTPVFPSTTFPNHYSQVTGLYPEHHGIISNVMWDSVFQERFYIGSGSAPAQDGKWYGGEPVWVTAEKHGLISASCFWPGSEAEIAGVRPTHYLQFDGSLPYSSRVEIVLGWLRLPSAQRPAFITLYFEGVDHAGHSDGPATPAVIEEIERIDGHLGDLIDGINSMGLSESVNLIIVSDHGMSQLSRDRVIFLDDYLDLHDVEVINFSPIADMHPVTGSVDDILQSLQGAHPHMAVYRKEDIPANLHYNKHRRIQPVLCIADDGWSITTRDYFDSHAHAFTGGAHGYVPQTPSMGAIFIASGPAFKHGLTIDAFESVHLYALMCHLLGVEPAPNDGSFAVLGDILVE